MVVTLLSCQSWFSETILRPELESSASKEPLRKRGRPALSFEEQGYDAQYKAADKIVSQYRDSPGVIFRAATIAACRAKKQHLAYILRKLEKEDSNDQALELRKAEKYFKTHPRKSFSKLFSFCQKASNCV